MKYIKYLSLHLTHDYFANSSGNVPRFVPTEDCQKQIRRNSLLFRTQPNGFTILADSDQAPDQPEGAGTFFDIAVYWPDPLFASYSNLDIDYRAGNIYYIGNSIDGGDFQQGGKRISLTDRRSAETFQAVPVRIQPKAFVFPVQAATGDSFVLKDKTNRIVRQWDIEGEEVPEALYADVKRGPAGIFILEKNGNVIQYFYADDTLYKEKPVFIIGIGPLSIDVNEAGKSRPPEYQIRIAARSVFWFYYVYATLNGRKLANLRVENNNPKLLEGITFDRQPIDEQYKRVIFTSGSPIPLMEKAYKSIQLTEEGNSRTPLIPNLPNADMSSLRNKDGKWYSEIFVYI
ncbi:MAG: hypothetical protein GY940_17800 [bacterium]|nr:hypothetical protein [bacterium]